MKNKEIVKWEGEYKIIRCLVGEFSAPRNVPLEIQEYDVISTLDDSKAMFVTKIDETGIYGQITPR